MAGAKQLTVRSREPKRDTKWRDAEGDVWSFDQATGKWGFKSHFMSGLDTYSLGNWAHVRREFASSFPMTEVIEDEQPETVTGQDLESSITRMDEIQVRSVDGTVGFQVKDSGRREELGNGFVRDTEEGKADFARILAIPGLELLPVEFLERWAAHMVKGAEKYGADNWRKAQGQHSLERFGRSAVRHIRQLIRGDRDEDHAAAVAFNVAAMEYVRGRLDDDAEDRTDPSGASA